MICPLAIAHTDDENWVHHDARIAELEAEVDRLKAQNADLRKTSISPENEESDG